MSLRLTAELAELIRRATAEALPEARPRKIPGRTAAAMVDIARDLRLKPKKGRLKDLARIERALNQLLELTAPKP